MNIFELIGLVIGVLALCCGFWMGGKMKGPLK